MTILGKEISLPTMQLAAVDLGSLIAIGVFLAYLATAFVS